MNRVGFSYDISAELLFTADEVRNMLKCSSEHYDGVCRQAGECGGFLWGLKTRFIEFEDDENVSTARLVFREVDTLCKILEGPGADVELAWKLNQVLKEINEEFSRISRT